MTHRQAFTATVGHAEQEARGRRCCPAGRVLRAILRLTVPALVAVAMLLGAGAPVRAFPGLDQPSVSIAAEHGSYGFGIDDVIFKLRRAGPADDAVSVRVSLAQAHLYLPTDRLNAVVRFRAGKRDAEFRIRARQFNGPATQSGALSATLVAAFGYTVGHPDSARTRLVVKNPAITVRPEQASYTVEPDDGAVRVTFVARTEGELPRPGKAFSLAVSSKAASDETAARRVARGVSQTVEFKPRDFVSTDGKWEASRTVSFSTAETAEGLEVMFKRAASTPERIRPRNSDGSTCTDDVCMVPVFMAQSEEPTLTIAAGQESYGFGIDTVVFTVTRNETAEGEIGGAVTLSQDENFVTSVSRTNFTIPANETSTDVELFRSLFDGDAAQSGDLTATIEAGDGYAVGTPGSATTRIVVADPAVTVRAERAAYRFVEGGAEATVAVVARTAPGVPPPGSRFPILVFSDPTSGTATVGDDYEELLTNVVFGPDDFTATGGVWEARKEVSLTIVDDDVTEADETVELRLRSTPDFTPQRIRPRNADGSACADDVCTVPVTIAANDGPPVARIEITPVPPAASADHGPYYIKDDFLALPDDTVHGRGATLTFTLNLDTEVTVTGTPELVLDIFDRERRARYTGGSGSRQLTFTWTVEKGDNDPDGLEFRCRNGARHQSAPLKPVAMVANRVSLPLHAQRVHGVLPQGAPQFLEGKGNDMNVYIGLDVSLASTSICVIGEKGKIVTEAQVASTPEALVAFMGKLEHEIAAIGLEAGPLSHWLHKGLTGAGFEAVLMETRRVKAALKAMPIKTDRRDAEGIARLLQMGWFRPVHCKSVSSQEMRALLTSRKSVLNALTNMELSLRGVLRNFGLKLGQVSKGRYEARVRELIAGNAMLEAAAEPILRARAALRRELAGLEKLVRNLAREDPVCRLLMTMPGVGHVIALTFMSAIDDPGRFRRSKDVGPWVGLTPGRAQSGERDIVGAITKCGDAGLRSALYQAATVMLNRTTGPNWLKAWAQRLTKLRGKKRATVALARRIGVVLHRMWRDGAGFRFTREEAMALQTA